MNSKGSIRKPYVISEDIHILLAEWAKKREFALPSGKFFRQLRKEMKEYLTGIFGDNNVDMISARELRNGIRRFIHQIGIPPVSMDRVYIRTKPEIQVSRMIDESLNDYGIGSRFGTPPISEQLFAVKERFNEIILVDDVIFSGKVITEILLSLETVGVRVPLVVAGITIGEGRKRLTEKTSAKILTVRYYEEVIDEICERDFYPGVPLSGRLVANTKTDTGAPYLHPFGKPYEWESIPREEEKKFSMFCLHQTIRLWKEIERISQRTARCCDLERIPLGAPYDKSSVVDYLKSLI